MNSIYSDTDPYWLKYNSCWNYSSVWE